jgi:aminomethyltransferase
VTQGELKLSPLDAAHRRLGAKMGEFAGFQMPIEYSGTLAEHRAVRESAGLFDLSHLGKVEVAGAGAAAALQHALTADVDRLAAPGSAQYTLCLDDGGGIVDDLIAYRTESGYLLVPNAANWPAVADQVRASLSVLGAAATVTARPDLAVVAVQGPGSPDLVGKLLPVAADLDYMHHAPATFQRVAVRVCRSGYTGEPGFELVLPAGAAGALWEALLAAGAVPAGLGARDTLRLEMGYPLHGNDITPETDPFAARLGWAVGMKTKGDFRGRAACEALRSAGPPPKLLTGLEALDRQIPRHGMTVRAGGQPVGEVTSGTFSPTLRRGIALAYLDAAVADPGTEVEIDVRGRPAPFRVTRPPFVPSSPK